MLVNPAIIQHNHRLETGACVVFDDARNERVLQKTKERLCIESPSSCVVTQYTVNVDRTKQALKTDPLC